MDDSEIFPNHTSGILKISVICKNQCGLENHTKDILKISVIWKNQCGLENHTGERGNITGDGM